MNTTYAIACMYQKISVDALEDFFELFKTSAFKRFKNETGEDPELSFLTFMNGDYESGIMTFNMFNQKIKYMHITAPEDQIEKAISKVRSVNNHLNLIYNMVGLDKDDFVYNRVTIRMKIK